MKSKLLKPMQRPPRLDATPWRPGDFPLGSVESRAAVRVMLAERQAASQREAQGLEVQDAVRDTYTWVTEYTKTFNEHWVEEGRPSPYEPFPRYDYLAILFEILDAGRIVWIEKSRDMMVSWACVAYPRHQAKVSGIKAIEKAIVVVAQREFDGDEKAAAGWLGAKLDQYAQSAQGSRPEKNLIPLPATWFNEGRYDDDPETWRYAGTGNGFGGHSDGSAERPKRRIKDPESGQVFEVPA